MEDRKETVSVMMDGGISVFPSWSGEPYQNVDTKTGQSKMRQEHRNDASIIRAQ